MKSEIESKQFLKSYGFTTTDPFVAKTAQQAGAHAATLSSPFVMKIVSADIVHKVAAGGVRLNVPADQAASCFDAIMAACRASHPQAAIDGVLLEEMVSGDIEVFLGARVDAQFGGVVLLGPGGSNVEKGIPPAAALSPLTEKQAVQLVEQGVEQLMHVSLSAAAKKALVQHVLAVAGEHGMLAKGVLAELDVNPIKIDGDRCVAVDAVVEELMPNSALQAHSAGAQAGEVERRKSRLGGMSALFTPKSVAFIGASTAQQKLGYRAIKNLVDFSYPGKIYPIHPTAPEICGAKAYASILDIPGEVDRAYIAVGANRVAEMLTQCKQKGVKVVQVLSAGFTEWTGEDGATGADLEEGVKKALEGTDMRMVGPNCLGTFSATGRLSMGSVRYLPTQTKGVTFISQSGTFASDVIRRAKVQGIAVSQVLSAGNCTDLDLIDYLLFCENDPATTAAAFYVESVRNPGLFFRVAQRMTKPVILLKGGTTEQGLTAASSHTAALATDFALWAAAVKQSGVLQVETFDDLMDALLIHHAHGHLSGNRLGIFGSGGGVSVTSSDMAARTGMKIPPLSPESGKALVRFGVPGTSVANPIDIPVWGLRDGDRLIIGDIINLLKRDPHLDSLIIYIEMGSIMDFVDEESQGLDELNAICAAVADVDPAGPSVSLVLRSTGDQTLDDFVRRQRLALLPKSIAVFSSTSRAVRAHASLYTMSANRRNAS
ncbi:MAG: acetate--CoA ligase family protein [Burkholderiaceae bacterium]